MGQEDKSFDDAAKEDTDITAWEAQVTWEPMKRTSIKLSTSNRFEEGSESSPGVAFEETIEQTQYDIRWNHNWNERIRSDVGLSLRDKAYLGGANDGRNDELQILSLGMSYSLRRRLEIGLEAQFRQNDSDTPAAQVNANYNRDTYFLTVTISL